MRYRLIDSTGRYKCVGTLDALKPIYVYIYPWKISKYLLILQRQTKRGNKWLDCQKLQGEWRNLSLKNSNVVYTAWAAVQVITWLGWPKGVD